MKLTLMIEGSADAIAAVLAALPEGEGKGVTIHNHVVTTGTAPTGPGSGHGGTAPMPTAPFPMTAAAPDDDDEDGTPSDAATDNTGLPWDERIHSGSKALTAKGVWKKRKGVSDDMVRAVEAELRAPSPSVLPQPVAIPTMAPTSAMPTPQPVMAAMPAAQPMTQAMPVVAQPEPMPVAPTGTTFPEFMQTLGTQMQGETPKITEANVAWVAQQIGLPSITDLGTNPEKIEQAVTLFRQYGLWID